MLIRLDHKCVQTNKLGLHGQIMHIVGLFKEINSGYRSLLSVVIWANYYTPNVYV